MKTMGLIVLVIIGMMTTVVSAADIAKFKIDGNGLGDSYDNVKKKLSCKEKPFDDGAGGWYISCKNTDNQQIDLKLDSKGKVYVIEKEVVYKSKPDWELIKKDIITKYASPSIVTTMMPANKEYFSTALIWSTGCYALDASKKYNGYTGEYPHCDFSGNSFSINIKGEDNRIRFQLISRDIENAHVNSDRAKNLRKNIEEKSSHSYNSWSIVSKNKVKDSGNSLQSFESIDIKCSDGTKGYINNFYNLSTSYRYFANGKNSFNSIEEAANNICGNK